MTVIIKIGRRLPRNWLTGSKLKGLMTFQENIWLIINRSMTLAKKKATEAPGDLNFVKKTYREPEDVNYDIEWIEIIINGNPSEEEEEYEEAMGMYKSLKQLFKRELKTDNDMMKKFNTKRLTPKQLDEAYKAGYGAAKDSSIAQKLLELGIITHIEKIDIGKEEILEEGDYKL